MKFVTSECVSTAHPDKLADQIADSIVDACLQENPDSKVGCEVLLTGNHAIVAGEISTKAHFKPRTLIQIVFEEAGVIPPENIVTLLRRQPQALFEANSKGASDQGFAIGYACTETENFMPLHYELARTIIKELHQARVSHTLPFLLPDAKTQVTLQYNEEGRIERLHTIVLSTQHVKNAPLNDLVEFITALIPDGLIDSKSKILINPGGPFIEGSIQADTGLTGRKLTMDTYGGAARDGGGSLSGKDPSKIDRAASYMARFIAKNICAATLADRVEVELVFAIGIKQPIALSLDTFGTEKIAKDKILHLIMDRFDLTTNSILKSLNLKRPIYSETAKCGHFGKDFQNFPDFTWEKIQPLFI